jgi:hypothetical protein
MENLVLVFILSSIVSVSVYLVDVTRNNAELSSLMKVVWGLTIVYSGVLGLAIYWYSGRKQIRTDSIYRRGLRSTAHCYSGCGLGEVLGVTLATLYFGGTNLAIAVGSFGFAYVFGFGLTVGPLVQEGVSLKESLYDAVTSETASITVMEMAAIGLDLYLIRGITDGLADPLFWVALFVSLSFGFIVAYPVNLLLLKNGVKEGMMNPQMLRD